LAQLVNIDFREMELSNVVAILAHKAGINVIAGTDLTGMVTANLQNVPLRQALETALRMEGLGMIEEKGIYFIVPYEEAVVAQRTTHMISLENAKAKEVSQILQDITRGTKNQRAISITANDVANIVVVAGPENDIIPLIDIIHQLDIAEPVLPTITEPIKLNYASAKDMATMIEKMLSPEVGQVAADERARHLVVTDVPVVVEQVRDLITKLDIPVKQVIIDAMVVDVTLGDEADTGVQWILESVRRQSRRSAALDPGGKMVGNLQELAMATDMTIGDAAGLLNFGLLSSEINWQGLIQAEVRNRNGRLVSNPVLVTVENEPAKITIAQEIPYIELTQTQQGGQQTSTQFKEVGTVLEVTPSVTHDRHIILNLDAKESGTLGEFQGVPIEDKRSLETTMRIASGQTIFVGGLRKKDMDTTVRKVPVLGDIPVMNFLFRSNSRSERVNELLIFMTCDILDEDLPRLTTYQEQAYSDSKNIEVKTNAMGAVWHNTGYPREMQDPIAKWRRTD
jgi:type IV pilus assembly protein PilQ